MLVDPVNEVNSGGGGGNGVVREEEGRLEKMEEVHIS
jgi:hypothetical protein